MFILCTYIDQQRWVSAFEPLLYPTGFSFYRPFSYVPRYFVPQQLGEQLADPSQRNSLLSQANWNEGFFGFRFKDANAPEFLPRFVPLRRVSLTAIEAGESLSLFFRLGGFIVPEVQKNQSSLPFLDVAELVGDVAATKLFVHLREKERSAAAAWRVSGEFPSGFWDAVESALSGPAAEKVKGTVLLRLSRLSRRSENSPLQVKEVEKARHIWGCELQESRVYDLHLNYYRIMRSGEDYSGHSQVFCITNDREEIQASRRAIPIIGNYRAEDLWISPLVTTQGPIQVMVEPCNKADSTAAVADESLAKMIGLKIPVAVKARQWPTVRIINLTLFVLSLVSAYYLWRHFPGSSDAVQKVLLVVIATCLSVAVGTLKDFLTIKR